MTRKAAWEVLCSRSEVPTREVDRVANRYGFDDRDRGLIRAIVGTEVRRRGSLRAIVRTFVLRRPKPELLTYLHIGLVQLLFMDRIPDHAAVSETCRAVSETCGQSKVPFVHGVLQNVLRARLQEPTGDPRRDLIGRTVALDRPVFRDPIKHPFLWAEDALSVPAALMKRWTRRYRNDPAETLARYFLSEPPLVLRALGDRDARLAELIAADIDARPGSLATSIVCPADATSFVTASEAFQDGALTVQGETAARAAELVGAKKGEEVLDLCAAPGGKTAVLAATGARVVAVDIDPKRLERARETCERLRVAGNVEFICSDGASELGGSLFDAVLIDAPCSNTGVLGARPDARWRFGPVSTTSIAALQVRLLDEGAQLVRPGGRLIWSTCSLEPEENGRRVAAFVDEHPEWELDSEENAVPDATKGPWDGGYAARLVRRGLRRVAR